MSSLGKRGRDDPNSSPSVKSESLILPLGKTMRYNDQEKNKELTDIDIANVKNLLSDPAEGEEEAQGLTFECSAPNYYADQYELAKAFVRNPIATKTPQFPHDLELTEAMKEFKNLVSNNPLNRRIPSEFFSSDFLSKFEEYSLRREGLGYDITNKATERDEKNNVHP